MSIREKIHRLPLGLYKGTIRATFTVSTKDKVQLFIEDKIVDEFVEKLKISNERYRIANWCYIFMPDHIHIANEGKDERSNLLKGMRLFKQYCGYYLARRNREVAASFSLRKGALTQPKGCGYRVELQKDYYDHIHRREEDLIKHIRYLLDNPVRKGLVEDWHDYKYKGSLDYNLQEIVR